MRILNQILALLLILSIGGVFQAALAGAEQECCADPCPDCAQGIQCICCPMPSPAVFQPDGFPVLTTSDTPCPVRSDDLAVVTGYADIFHPPRAC
jgi:hypothetical protein